MAGAYQHAGHAEHQHVHKVWCTKLEGAALKCPSICDPAQHHKSMMGAKQDHQSASYRLLAAEHDSDQTAINSQPDYLDQKAKREASNVQKRRHKPPYLHMPNCHLSRCSDSELLRADMPVDIRLRRSDRRPGCVAVWIAHLQLENVRPAEVQQVWTDQLEAGKGGCRHTGCGKVAGYRRY